MSSFVFSELFLCQLLAITKNVINLLDMHRAVLCALKILVAWLHYS
jgi:hypothetical protein